MKRSYAFIFVSMLFAMGLSWNRVSYCGEYDQGKSLYQEKCFLCHGADGKGDGPAAATLSQSPKDFNNPEFWRQKDVGQLIVKTIKNGLGPMPAFHLNQDEINAITDYMSHTFKK
jgi:mono/diheme cytochrome c family protein